MLVQRLNIGDVTLEFSKTGLEDRETVLFLHGLGPGLRQFTPQIEHFSATYQVLAVSLRGHGGSTVPKTPRLEDFSLQRYALDIQQLLAQLGVRRVHLVGNSMGGLVGFELIQKTAGLVASLTTFGTTAELHSSPALVWLLTTTTRILGPAGLARLVSASIKNKDIAQQMAGMVAQANKQALIFSQRQIAHYDYTHLLRSLCLPYLLIQGDQDRDINAQLKSTLEAVRMNPNAVTTELKGVGHFVNMEEPEVFNRVLGDFIRGVIS